MKWGVKNGPPYPIDRSKDSKQRFSVEFARSAASKVHAETVKYADGGPAGNQNCKLCTWAMEMQFRGEDILPRPVYSPRDPEFDVEGYDLVKGAKKQSIEDLNSVKKLVSDAGEGSRFYTHVNWKDSTGGHEFLTVNLGGESYVIDGQAGTVAKLGTSEGKKYFSDINYKNSYMVRMDDKEIDRSMLKYNDRKYLLKWDQKKDIQFMYENDMLSDEDIESFGLSKKPKK